MRFDTVIRNGTIVTATDTYVADIGIAGETNFGDWRGAADRKRAKSDRRARHAGDARVALTCIPTWICRLAERRARTISNRGQLRRLMAAPQR